MGFKLTPEVSKHLQEFADRITPPQKPQPTGELTGKELREKHGIITDGQGRPLEDTKLYIAKAPPAVNHHRRLCKAYEAGGYDAVEKYLEPYKTPEAIQRDKAKSEDEETEKDTAAACSAACGSAAPCRNAAVCQHAQENI